MIKIGCCGFPVSRKRYFELFPVVEIQQTFYQPPQFSLAQKWRREAPGGFEYTMKAWQLITHEPNSPIYRRLKAKIPKAEQRHYGSFKPTEEVHVAWETTREIADASSVAVTGCPRIMPRHSSSAGDHQVLESRCRASFMAPCRYLQGIAAGM
ncbi:MAG TPA: DUF72 domain-containing protein, partial [Nitrospirota bacterium]|nr:DUF72 domain-containing protein [Nitrospirota bacterium]